MTWRAPVEVGQADALGLQLPPHPATVARYAEFAVRPRLRPYGLRAPMLLPTMPSVLP